MARLDGQGDGATIALAALALLWAGMAIGVAWIATPVKFQAPSLTLPVALEVGRATFRLFGRIEWGLAALLAALTIAVRPPRAAAMAAVLLIALIAATGALLLPALNLRTAMIIAGTVPPPSHLHHLYLAAEAAKLCLLFVIATAAVRRLKGDAR